MEKQQKDLEEETETVYYYYLNGWQKCSGKTYREVFKEMYSK